MTTKELLQQLDVEIEKDVANVIEELSTALSFND